MLRPVAASSQQLSVRLGFPIVRKEYSAVIPIDDLPGPQHIPNQVNLHQLCGRVEEANMVLFFLWYYQSSTGFSYAILWRNQPAVCQITLVVNAEGFPVKGCFHWRPSLL